MKLNQNILKLKVNGTVLMRILHLKALNIIALTIDSIV